MFAICRFATAPLRYPCRVCTETVLGVCCAFAGDRLIKYLKFTLTSIITLFSFSDTYIVRGPKFYYCKNVVYGQPIFIICGAHTYTTGNLQQELAHLTWLMQRPGSFLHSLRGVITPPPTFVQHPPGIRLLIPP